MRTDGILTGGRIRKRSTIARRLAGDRWLMSCGSRAKQFDRFVIETGTFVSVTDVPDEGAGDLLIGQLVERSDQTSKLVLDEGIIQVPTVSAMPSQGLRKPDHASLNGVFILATGSRSHLLERAGAVASIAPNAAQRVRPGLSANSASKVELAFFARTTAFGSAAFVAQRDVACDRHPNRDVRKERARQRAVVWPRWAVSGHFGCGRSGVSQIRVKSRGGRRAYGPPGALPKRPTNYFGGVESNVFLSLGVFDE